MEEGVEAEGRGMEEEKRDVEEAMWRHGDGVYRRRREIWTHWLGAEDERSQCGRLNTDVNRKKGGGGGERNVDIFKRKNRCYIERWVEVHRERGGGEEKRRWRCGRVKDLVGGGTRDREGRGSAVPHDCRREQDVTLKDSL